MSLLWKIWVFQGKISSKVSSWTWFEYVDSQRLCFQIFLYFVTYGNSTIFVVFQMFSKGEIKKKINKIILISKIILLRTQWSEKVFNFLEWFNKREGVFLKASMWETTNLAKELGPHNTYTLIKVLRGRLKRIWFKHNERMITNR